MIFNATSLSLLRIVRARASLRVINDRLGANSCRCLSSSVFCRKIEERPSVQLFRHLSLTLPKMANLDDPHISSERIQEMLSDELRHMDYNVLLERRKDGPCLVIDVRQPEEINETGTIPDSVCIPLNEVEEVLGAMTPEAFRMTYGAEKPRKGTLIIFSCRSGRRSLTALTKALQLGFLNSAHYKGGWLDWERHTKKPER